MAVFLVGLLMLIWLGPEAESNSFTDCYGGAGRESVQCDFDNEAYMESLDDTGER